MTVSATSLVSDDLDGSEVCRSEKARDVLLSDTSQLLALLRSRILGLWEKDHSRRGPLSTGGTRPCLPACLVPVGVMGLTRPQPGLSAGSYPFLYFFFPLLLFYLEKVIIHPQGEGTEFPTFFGHGINTFIWDSSAGLGVLALKCSLTTICFQPCGPTALPCTVAVTQSRVVSRIVPTQLFIFVSPGRDCDANASPHTLEPGFAPHN